MPIQAALPVPKGLWAKTGGKPMLEAQPAAKPGKGSETEAMPTLRPSLQPCQELSRG